MIASRNRSIVQREGGLCDTAFVRPAGIIPVGRDHTGGKVDLLQNSGMAVVDVQDLNANPIAEAAGRSHPDCGAAIDPFVIRRRRLGPALAQVRRYRAKGKRRLVGAA